MTSSGATKIRIDSNPGAGRIGDGEWGGYMGDIKVEDCSHGGSIASIEITGYGDEFSVSAFLELTPEDVHELIDVLMTIQTTIRPESETDTIRVIEIPPR